MERLKHDPPPTPPPSRRRHGPYPVFELSSAGERRLGSLSPMHRGDGEVRDGKERAGRGGFCDRRHLCGAAKTLGVVRGEVCGGEGKPFRLILPLCVPRNTSRPRRPSTGSKAFSGRGSHSGTRVGSLCGGAATSLIRSRPSSAPGVAERLHRLRQGQPSWERFSAPRSRPPRPRRSDRPFRETAVGQPSPNRP